MGVEDDPRTFSLRIITESSGFEPWSTVPISLSGYTCLSVEEPASP